jgi:hypothetical protein
MKKKVNSGSRSAKLGARIPVTGRALGVTIMARTWRIFTSLIILICATTTVHAGSYEVTADEWARPRSGSRIISIASLQKVVDAIAQQPGTVVTVQYAGGDEGLLWAEELRGWFVALGVAGDQLVLRSGLQVRDRLVLSTD